MRTLFTLILALAALIGSRAQTEPNIFVYCPGEHGGLRLAVSDVDGTWNDIGQLCSSDYGTWGAEKRMFSPSITRKADGTWRLVFQVNDRAPVFAAAYSRNLTIWRPQDYPICREAGQCLEPVVTTEGNQDVVVFKNKAGQTFCVKASDDFRHFSKPETVAADRHVRPSNTARIAVGGKEQNGQTFTLGDEELKAVKDYFAANHAKGRLTGERMHDDAKNLSRLTAPVEATLSVDFERQKPISDKLIGIFFEDISYAADGGLYAELVQNRDFEYSSKDRGGWTPTTAWHSPRDIRIATDNPLTQQNPHHAIVADDSLWNEGWDGIAVEAGKRYDFSMFVRGKKRIEVKIIDEDGTALAAATINAKAKTWTRYEVQLNVTRTADKARLLLLPDGKKEAAIDMVSLFPQETFKNRKNGLRRDLAETIAALKPKFVRFPGGCMSHGQGLDNIYHWQHTIGPLEERTPDLNIWHYHQTRGLGFFEFFQFCEDIGAEPLPVLAAGVPCQNSANNAEGLGGQQGGILMADMPQYIDELLHLIEWANGDPATSEWARKRAEAGHPEPFGLKYIGIGNEDIISTVFEERYDMICRAIRQHYPDIKICGTVGPFHTPSADYIEGWDFVKRNPDLQYMTDEHYYESTGWFLHNRDYYDRYDRRGTKVYLGEWAASTNVKRPNMETALAEALYLTDIERNGDVVEMTSYAPMLAKDGHHNWNPDMIYFSNTAVRPTTAYHVQRLFSIYSGDRYVKAKLTVPDDSLAHRVGASVVCDSKSGKRYVKLVNALPVEMCVNLDGINLEGAKGEQLAGEPTDQRAAPRPIEFGREVVLPMYSVTVVELKESNNINE